METKKLDSSGLNLNWIKMLTRTREYYIYINLVRESLIRFGKRLGKSTNIYQHIPTHTHTFRINYVYFFSSWRFRCNNNDVYLENGYTTSSLKTVYGNEGNWMVFSYSSSRFRFVFFLELLYSVSERELSDDDAFFFVYRYTWKGAAREEQKKGNKLDQNDYRGFFFLFFLNSALLILMRERLWCKNPEGLYREETITNYGRTTSGRVVCRPGRISKENKNRCWKLTLIFSFADFPNHAKRDLRFKRA